MIAEKRIQDVALEIYMSSLIENELEGLSFQSGKDAMQGGTSTRTVFYQNSSSTT